MGQPGSQRLSILGKAYLVALFVVFLHYVGQIKSLSDEISRYFFLWHRRTGVAILLSMLLVAAIGTLMAFGGKWLARKIGWPILRRLLSHILPLLLLSGVLAASPAFAQMNHPTLTKVIWLGAMVVTGYSAARPDSPLVRWTYKVCLIFSPVTFIIAVQMLSWGNWQTRPRTSFAPRSSATTRSPVFVFVLEEWSYLRSTEDQQFRPFFKNLRRLAECSVVCQESLSPADGTWRSIPRLLYQNDLDAGPRDGLVYWEDGEGGTPTQATPSLFQMAKDRGYNTYAVGWAIPYEQLLGDQVDYCHVYPGYPRGRTIPEEMVVAVVRNFRYLTDPVGRRGWRYVHLRWLGPHHHRTQQAMSNEIAAILNGPSNAFGVFHSALVHWPFVWNPDGSYHYPGDEPRTIGYERALRYADAYIGRMVQTLRAAGRFDDALLIFTGDHSFRKDCDPRVKEQQHWQRRVPLIIKLPGQEAGAVIRETLASNELMPLFKAVFSGERDTEDLLQLIRELAAQKHAE